MKKNIIILIIAFTFLIIAALFIIKNKKENDNLIIENKRIVSAGDNKEDIDKDWIIYENKEINFSLYHPKNLTFKDNAFWDEGDYEKFNNPNMTDHFYFPQLNFFVANENETINEFIEKNYNYNNHNPSLKEEIFIGKNKFIENSRIFYIKINDKLVAFSSPSNNYELLKEILKTLYIIK